MMITLSLALCENYVGLSLVLRRQRRRRGAELLHSLCLPLFRPVLCGHLTPLPCYSRLAHFVAIAPLYSYYVWSRLDSPCYKLQVGISGTQLAARTTKPSRDSELTDAEFRAAAKKRGIVLPSTAKPSGRNQSYTSNPSSSSGFYCTHHGPNMSHHT